LHWQQPEEDKQNFDVAPTKKFLRTPMAAACFLLTCLPQQNLAASSAIKVHKKWYDFIVIIVLYCILAIYFE